ncbi:hypothetical protein DKX38_002587 [Salix brachista]|uniref:DYW domain-containing protein n=1 Tax=Salix brachista TaxID=2182728 RepID=A0A5N5NMN6_9ROSI|nr:hypothetical protein DKX38_002587 [Salix brachista]
MSFLVNVYAKCGVIVNARKVFDNLPGSNAVVWITLITGYVRNSQPKCIALGKQFHAFIIKYRTSTTPALGMLFVACTRNLAAWNLRPKYFLETREKDVISGRWLYLLVVIMAEQGVRIFIEMLLENDEPNKLRLTTVLGLCSTVQSSDLRAQNGIQDLDYVECNDCRLAALEQGEQIHAQTINSVVFIRCSCRNCSWDMHDNWVQLFEDMRQAGFRPNQVPFVGLLAACSHAGMVDRALEYFELMQKEYKIKPVMVHYGYLVGMFLLKLKPKILKLMYVARYVNLCREAGGCFHGDKVGKLKNRAKSLGYKLVENMDVIDVKKRKPERTFSSCAYKYEVGSSIWVIEYARWITSLFFQLFGIS